MSIFGLIIANSIFVHWIFVCLCLFLLMLLGNVKVNGTKKSLLMLASVILSAASDLLLVKLTAFFGTAVNFWKIRSHVDFLSRLEFFSSFVRENLFGIGAPLLICTGLLLYLIWYATERLIAAETLRKLAAILIVVTSVPLTLGLSLPILAFMGIFHHHRTGVFTKKISGSEVFESDPVLGKHRVEQALKPVACDGIQVFPDFRLARFQEGTHLLIAGSQGSGKSNLLFGIIEDIIKRGDKVVLYDYKHDFTSAFFGDPRVALLTPFDTRSLVWDVAKDLKTTLDAEEFAKVLCPDEPENGKPFFTTAARDLIVGCITKLQAECEGTWTFSDLYRLVSDKDNIAAACRSHRAEALQTIGSSENDQGLGVIGEVRNRTRTLAYLAKAWPDATNAMSVTEWLSTHGNPSVIIIQSNPRFGELDKFFTIQIFSYLFREVLSMEDNLDRRIWAVIDEFPTLPLLPDFANTLRVGRSKGLCVIAVVQDFGRLKQVYEREGGMEALSNGFGIKLIGRLNSSEAAEYASQLCGDIELERKVIGRAQAAGKTTRTEQVGQPDKKRAVPASTFLNLKLCNLREPARFYFISSGLPIVCFEHKIVPIETVASPTVASEWMARTPREETMSVRIRGALFGEVSDGEPNPC